MDDGRDSPAAEPAKTDNAVKPQSNTDYTILKRHSIQDLEAFTYNFDRHNLIGLTQFGQLYRGKLEETGKEVQSVTIKKWSDPPTCYPCTHDIDVMLNEELTFLTQPGMKSQPNFVKLIGYCCEERMTCVVYDLKPMDTLHNVMTKDVDNFGWIQRIKVAVSLARLLNFLHKKENPYFVKNVDTAHIILDQDYNPFMVDFGLMSGGILGDVTLAKHATPMTPGYGDIYEYMVLVESNGIEPGLAFDKVISRGGVFCVEMDDGRDSPATEPPKTNNAVKPQSNTDYTILKRHSIQDLEAFTYNFDRNNLLGLTQFGQLYRGKLEETGKEARYVTIKQLKDEATCYRYAYDMDAMLDEELTFLTHPSMNSQPHLVKLIGYFCEEQMKGVIYDLNPMDTLHNVMTKDNFGWIQRIKVALALARFLKFLHRKQNSYLVQNVDTAHIILDQDYNPFIVDFGLMSGGIIGDPTDVKRASPMTPGYCDMFGATYGVWSTYSDVYAYGVIVIELITKRITENRDISRGVVDATDTWASKILKSGKSIEVHPSLQQEQCYKSSDGRFLVELGKRCIGFHPAKPPYMAKIVKCLEHVSGEKSRPLNSRAS